jgi:hypothetical protein
MSFFGSLFGKDSKVDYGKIMPDPPQMRIDDADVLLRQFDDLIQQYDDVVSGKSIFDAVQYIFEPQKAAIEQMYGFGAPGALTQAGLPENMFART